MAATEGLSTSEARRIALRAQRFGVNRLSLLEKERVTGDELRWCQTIERCGSGGDQHVDFALCLRQSIEGFEPLGDQILMR